MFTQPYENVIILFLFHRFEGEFYEGEHDVDKEEAYVEVSLKTLH